MRHRSRTEALDSPGGQPPPSRERRHRRWKTSRRRASLARRQHASRPYVRTLRTTAPTVDVALDAAAEPAVTKNRAYLASYITVGPAGNEYYNLSNN